MALFASCTSPGFVVIVSVRAGDSLTNAMMNVMEVQSVVMWQKGNDM
jgi:hypothetical protein